MYPRSVGNSSSQRVVCLNVGGQLFSTSYATLKKDPDCTLAQMFSGARLAEMAIDEAGRCFIDRDPKHFNTILNYLRDGECDLPAIARERKEILREAEHYELSGLEELLSMGPYADSAEGGDFTGAATAAPLAVPHASEAYFRILDRARGEAGADNIARCEAAIFAIMFGAHLAPPASPFQQQQQPGGSKGVATGIPVARPHHHPGHAHGHGGRHSGGCHEDSPGITQLGRRSLSLRSRTSQDVHPLDRAGELGAHCSGPELASFIRRYFSVMQADFLRRGYLFQADRGAERLYLEIPLGAAAPDEASGVMFEGLVQSLSECCVAGEGRGDVRGVSFRKTYRKH